MDLITPDIGLIFWQTLVFLIILGLLAKFAWKPILGAIEEREKTIDNSLKEAQRAREEMEKLSADNERILADARRERDKIILDAKETAKAMVNEARDGAREEGKKELADAKEAIRNERLNAVTEIRNMIGSLSVDIAEKILEKNLSDEGIQQEMIDNHLEDISFN